MADIDTENLGNPGDVSIDELFLTLHDGTDIDILNFMVQFDLYEDIWNTHMHGSIVIADGQNLIEKAPIMGGEGVTFKIRNKTFEDEPFNVIDKTMQVYAIEQRQLNNDREQFYSLKFISIEAIQDQTISISKRFKGNSADIVAEIYEDYIVEYRRPGEAKVKSDLIIGDTPHTTTLNYLSNFWTPAQNLVYIAKYAKGSTKTGADFIYYESNKNFYFTSLQQLIGSQKDQLFDEYIYAPPGLDVPHREGGGDYIGIKLPKNFVSIEAIEIPRTIDILDGNQTGYYSQTVRAYDLYAKEKILQYIDVRDDFEAFEHTDPGIPVPSGIQRNPYAMTTIKVLNSFNNAVAPQGIGPRGNNNENIVAASLYRDNYFNSFKDYTFEIDVPGRTDIEVGRMIKMIYPAATTHLEDSTYEDLVDETLSGNYLITAIRHKIDTVGYTMKMEIVKNGLAKSLGPKDNVNANLEGGADEDDF